LTRLAVRPKVPTLVHQTDFITDVTTPYIGLVGGFGCGKTHALCLKGIHLASLNPGYTGALLEPIGSMIPDILQPTMEDILEQYKIRHTYRASPQPSYTLKFKQGDCKILLRSGENYRRLVGTNLAFFGVDEADTIESVPLAWKMWRVLQSRLRSGLVRQGFTTSTPEGFKFLYELFVKNAGDDRRIIHARTMDNPYLPPDFIEDLLRTYPPQLIKAYLNGEFTNLTSSNVYHNFDRTLNVTDKTIEDFDKYEPLHIGQDFNVGKCASVVHIIDRNGQPIAVDEIMGVKNTERVIEIVKERYPDRAIFFYPDSSGKNEKSNSTMTDIILLKQAGFELKYRSTNPRIKDRVGSMNAMFLNGKGERRYKVNVAKCPVYVDALEQQAYNKEGMPDKMHDKDHPNDASGYFIHMMYPLAERPSLRTY
jgi:hypothetical protein